MTSARRSRSAFVAVALFTLFAGEAIRNTLSWYGFAAWVGILFVVSAVVLVRVPAVRRGTPARAGMRMLTDSRVWLSAFVLWAVGSLAWSEYPGGTLLAAVALIATTTGALAIDRVTDPDSLVRGLLLALGAILVLSFVFELVVAAVVREPVLPVFPIDVPDDGRIPAAFYWSRAELFDGGPIQGILGNSNLLGFVALLAVVVAGAALRERRISARLAVTVLLAGLLGLALTRSATVLAAALAVAVVAALAVSFAPGGRPARRAVGWALVAVASAATVLAIAFSRPILDVLGKSPDLTGRLDIWSAVAGLVMERPLAGWGWVAYWQPWIPLFDGLAVRRGVEYLQAHNAYLDVVFQLGAIGLVFFLGLVLTVVVRGVRAAPRTLIPLLLIVALVAQSLAESRLLYEGNWALLVLLAVGALVTRADTPGAVRTDGNLQP